MEKIITENDITPNGIWNLDENGATSGRDANGLQNCKVYMTRTGAKDANTGAFLNTNCVTVMPVISVSGPCASPLLVLKGRRLPYRVVYRKGFKVVETYANNIAGAK